MRIAQVAPLYESVPPKYYGGTERIVSYLTEELVQLGHDVTLFASGNSLTGARMVPICPRSLRLDPSCIDPLAHHFLLLERVFHHAENGEFDIVHFHCDYLHFPLTRRFRQPNVTTLHGRLDLPDLGPLYREYPEIPVVSISNSQRLPLPWANWQATVHHGLPLDLYEPCLEAEDYLAFAGRISPEKGLDSAIEIARQTGMKLRVAAKVDRADDRYFKEVIEPQLQDPLVEFVGEIGQEEKNDFFGKAGALLVPVNWPEPFGLVMIEALACGTPVIGWRRGSVPEVIDDGITGYIVETVPQAVRAVNKIHEIRRKKCREVFERRFDAARMTQQYLAVYQRLVAGISELGRTANGSGRRHPNQGTVLHPLDLITG
jgi:glycosyltransferase involved in cell wall biosynthesis